jgi:hypothetical protein
VDQLDDDIRFEIGFVSQLGGIGECAMWLAEKSQSES